MVSTTLVEVFVDLGIPEAQCAKTLRGEMRVALGVMREAGCFTVLTAVDLDDEPMFEADEVENIALERRLSAEVETLGTQPAQMHPQLHLLRGHRLAKRAGSFVRHDVFHAGANPTRPPSAATLPVKGRDGGCIRAIDKLRCSGLQLSLQRKLASRAGAHPSPLRGGWPRGAGSGGGPSARLHRLTSQVVVPSLLSLSATPIAASSSRMRSDSSQSLAARAARRAATSADLLSRSELPITASVLAAEQTLSVWTKPWRVVA